MGSVEVIQFQSGSAVRCELDPKRYLGNHFMSNEAVFLHWASFTSCSRLTICIRHSNCLAEKPRSHKSIAVPVPPKGPSPFHPRRRDMLAYIGASVAGLAYAPVAQAQTPQATIAARMGENQRFDPAVVIDIARQLSKKPFVPPPNDLPDVFANLNQEQYSAIRYTQPPIWSTEARGIAVEPLHRGFVFRDAVDLYLVEDGAVRRIAYSPSQFDFGRLNVPNNIADIGFSGFKLIAQIGNGQPFDFAFVQGATFFRALARGQNYGAIARALTLKPAEARGRGIPDLPRLLARAPGRGQQRHHGAWRSRFRIDHPAPSG